MWRDGISKLGKIALLLLVSCDISGSVEFHRRTTGVGFSAYIKRSENGSIPGWKTYTMADLKTMLKVISKKFTRVATFGVGADNVPYEEGVTYGQSNAQVMSAEAAASINNERQEKNMTVIIGMWLSDIALQTHTEIQVALESARVANSIFDGTAEGFVFSQNDIHSSLTRARETLAQIRVMRNHTNLKIGSRQQCYGISGDGNAHGELSMIRREIVEASDFIICEIGAAEHNLPSGAENGFITVQFDLLGFRREFQRINPRIEVMGQTGWSYRGSKSWETLENLEKYWSVVDKWGADHNFTMWMLEAFDNPWKNWAPHNGWWRLKQNALTNQTQGYAENIVDPPPEEKPDSSGLGIGAYIGIVVGVILVAVVLGAVGLLYFRVQKLQDFLTTDDVKEFMYGMSDETAAQQGGDAALSALKFPYDKSYEISKEKLNIKRDALLGSGQFGCVYKALIEGDEKVEVALKMTKNNCGKTALVGILSEIKILTYLGKHPNIVSIHGAYTAELTKGIIYVATELCPHGSLEDYLRKNAFDDGGNNGTGEPRYANAPKSNLNDNLDGAEMPGQSEIRFADMVRWSHEVACGMEYLGTKHVVHADLATRNVLLAADKTAKITDFGLSRKLYDYTNYVKKQQEPLPWRWMAIESLKRLEFSEKSDVWSYGVTLWEIFALGDLPYPGLSWNLEFVDTLVNGLRMKSPPHATPAVYEIMCDCWHSDPKQRPSFNDLKLSTAHILESSIN